MAALTPEQALQYAIELHRAGRLAEAEPIYRQLLALEPQNPDLLQLLGLLGCTAGHPDAGLALIEQAIALSPQARYLTNYSTQLMNVGRIDEAAAAVESALQLEPANVDALYNLGLVRERQRRFEEAIVAYRHVLERRPDYTVARLNVGMALAAAGRVEEGIALYEEALRAQPGSVEITTNLGSLYRSRGELTRAIECLRQVLAVAPENAVVRNNLALALKDECAAAEAVTELRTALTHRPDSAEIHSNLVFTLFYVPGHPGLAEEMAVWNQRFVAPLAANAAPHWNERSPERRLRVGYVSPDLRNHVVARALLPVFEKHDYAAVELVCYSSAVPDATTARFRARAERWHEISGWSDERLAAQIRADGVDVLVDLALHTSDHRLLAFARKPAPVQVAWLGYPDATGMQTVDAWLGDRFLANAAAGGEPVFPLPETWTIFEPPAGGPEPNELPAASAGAVTFASFNNFGKHSEATWDAWARILGELPEARLMMLVKTEAQRAKVRGELQQRGVAAERVLFQDYVPPAPDADEGAFLRRYHAVDIALDPFPYNGMTTTCEALWMGVPVIALIGERGISRAGFSLLSNVGHAELAAACVDDYVRTAVALARDRPRLAALRASLRGEVAASPLLDAARLARNVEAAYRELWRRWCRGAAR